MYKYIIVTAFAICFSLTTANANFRDSIGVENLNGKKLVVHKIVANDTYYSLGRRYKVVPKEIMTFNDNKYLQVGVIVKVPTSIPFSGSSSTPVTSATTVQETTAQTPEGNLVEHVVQKKENLNMLAEKYGTTVNEIKRINNLHTINLQIGQTLKIPSKNVVEEVSDIIATTSVVQKPKESVPVAVAGNSIPKPVETTTTPATKPGEQFIEHTVSSNETMYSIATKYKMTMDQLKAKNNLTDNSLRVGQKLLIKGEYPVIPAYVPPVNMQDSVNSLKDPSLRYPAARYGLNQIDEKGTATWISDPDLDPSKMLVLHRSAPIGTVMKITNPMSNRSTFAKVVGKFTENETTKDVIIVMTKAVADALGALDKRFYCNLTYGGPDDEQK